MTERKNKKMPKMSDDERNCRWREDVYEPAQALSSPTGYRLIDESDTIELTDEFLEHDAETWTPVSNGHWWMVGHKWGNCYVPMRRKVDNND